MTITINNKDYACEGGVLETTRNGKIVKEKTLLIFNKVNPCFNARLAFNGTSVRIDENPLDLYQVRTNLNVTISEEERAAIEAWLNKNNKLFFDETDLGKSFVALDKDGYPL